MIARTAGPCVGDCGGRIHPGDEIEGVPGEGWRHVECGHVGLVKRSDIPQLVAAMENDLGYQHLLTPIEDC